ncbi:hypothetical protein [Flavobacterium inviolabile]|uniref:hypothetical protein n=1 Tax=Flavobacterium inviolabile TaxID=2748320 RepID=UPI0015A86168|nr:hypothetical protein [Flavobacterium inviolabile]
MHWTIKRKLATATKLYLVEPEDNKAIEIKIQLPTGEYVEIELNHPFPKNVYYKSLANGGFNYDPIIDMPITHYSKRNTLRNLRNSIAYRSNNSDTIDKLINLVNTMSDI